MELGCSFHKALAVDSKHLEAEEETDRTPATKGSLYPMATGRGETWMPERKPHQRIGGVRTGDTP